MGKVFFTKKQKAKMRERRRKKKMSMQQDDSAENNSNNSTNDLTSVTPEDEQDISSIGKKRQRSENKKSPFDFTFKVIEGKTQVLVPAHLSNKEAKKFRKECRRQLREEGKDDENIAFMVSDDFPSKKRRKQYPSIKELLEEKKQAEKVEKEELKRQEKIQDIPETLKAQYVALDCEMVGIGTGGKKSALARVSLVDWEKNVVLDSFVKVPIRVTDFRTHVSGVEPKHIKDSTAMDVEKCRELVASLLKDKILIGHALANDLKALLLTHPKLKIRDTAKYRPFQRFHNGKWRPRKLRDLVKENLKGKESFQEGEHDSVQDAMATMELFQLVQSAWEKEIASKINK